MSKCFPNSCKWASNLPILEIAACADVGYSRVNYSAACSMSQVAAIFLR